MRSFTVSLSSLVLAAVAGGVVGYHAHAYIFQPTLASLSTGQFVIRLAEDSAAFRQLKSSQLDCLSNTLKSRIQADIEQADFYRSLAAKDDQQLALVNDSIVFAQEVLNEATPAVESEKKKCS